MVPKIFVFDISDLENLNIYNMFKKVVSEERRKKSENFRFFDDSKRCICAEAIMRYYLIKFFFINNSDIKIMYNEHGKPFLNKIPLYFNLSHSGKWVVCAWSKNEIGVDIEKIDKIKLDIATSFFCKEEIDYIKSDDENEQCKRFIQIWTLKESYIKYIGKGLTVPLNSFCVKKNDNSFNIECEGNIENVFLKQLEFSNDYYLTVCSRDESEIEVQKITIDELVNVFMR